MKRLLVALVLATSLLAFGCTKGDLNTTWQGQVDESFTAKVVSDIAKAEREHLKKLIVDLNSPGGGVLDVIDITRMMHAAEDRGLIIEVHAHGICASGCTFILGAGSKGYRYVTRQTLVLIHPIQTRDFFGPPTCLDFDMAKVGKDTVDGKAVSLLLSWMREEYMRDTGRGKAETTKWLMCGKEQVGDGSLFIKLGLADKVE